MDVLELAGQVRLPCLKVIRVLSRRLDTYCEDTAGMAEGVSPLPTSCHDGAGFISCHGLQVQSNMSSEPCVEVAEALSWIAEA